MPCGGSEQLDSGSTETKGKLYSVEVADTGLRASDLGITAAAANHSGAVISAVATGAVPQADGVSVATDDIELVGKTVATPVGDEVGFAVGDLAVAQLVSPIASAVAVVALRLFDAVMGIGRAHICRSANALQVGTDALILPPIGGGNGITTLRGTS
jgi:hypothetical protein